MKKAIVIFLVVLVSSCSAPKKATSKKPLFEILTEQEQGGADIQFYELLTEPNEIKMLLSDPALKRKISKEDLNQASFVILNMGQKPSDGYHITIESAKELENLVLLKVKEHNPNPVQSNAAVVTYPYMVVKINSKKPVVIK